MIVQCEECKTSFNLDEKRLRGDSAKVRCSKCKHVFMIYKNQDEMNIAPNEDIFDGSISAGGEDDTFAMASPLDDAAFSTSMFTDSPDEEATPEEPFASTFDEISYTTEAEAEPVAASFEPSSGSDDFAFNDMSFDSQPAEEVAEPAPPIATPKQPSFDDDMLSFADVTPTDEELAKPAPLKGSDLTSSATTAKSFDFDFSETAEPAEFAKPAETFDHGGFDFSMPTPEPAKEAPTAFTFAAEESTSTFVPVPSAEDISDESAFSTYRPFAIAGLCATALISVLTAGYFMVKGAPGNLERMGIQNISSASDAEKGSFTITSPSAKFIKNTVNGELFVVSGTATNGYTSPRTGIEVQVTLFNKKGEELATKTAFCGSAINNSQLITLPLAKIEEELTKPPSEDPLENTPVEPGKTTNCLVIFKEVPKAASDYGIEVTHSSGEQLDDF